MSSDATLRLAQPRDAAAVRACVRTAYSHYVQRIGGEPAPMSADYEHLITRGLVYVLGFPSVDHITGVLVLRHDARVLWIDNVAVDPQYQHRGYGRQLLAFAEDEARAAGLTEVALYTHELMVENISLYRRLGYAEFDRRVDDGFPRVFLRKPLQAS